MMPDQNLIACPVCDALYHVAPGTGLTCKRCHTALIVAEKRAGVALLVTTLLSVMLVFGAVSLPFLSITRFWITSETTLVGAAFAFDPPLLILSLAVLALVLLLPTARLLLTLYVVTPLVLARAPWPRAATAYRWSESLRPWSMAEVFAIGCGVALLKIADMAEVTFGPAFYLFAALVITLWVQDRMVCRYGIWRALRA